MSERRAREDRRLLAQIRLAMRCLRNGTLTPDQQAKLNALREFAPWNQPQGGPVVPPNTRKH